MKGYADFFALPVRKKNLKAYCRMSQRFGKIIKQLGATEYREFVGDDLNVKGTRPFTGSIRLNKGEVLVTAVVGYRSKAQRDKINKSIQHDPRVLKIMKDYKENPPFDGKRMLYGGFETIVKV